MKKFTIKCIKCSDNNNLLNTYKDNIAEERSLNDLAELFKVFGDSNRIKILFALLVPNQQEIANLNPHH